MSPTEDRAVRFDRFGGPEVYRVVPVPVPEPGSGEVRVRVHVAGLNPVDAKIAAGGPSRYSPTLPSGNGNDYAGVIDAVGAGVEGLAVGDRVFGGHRFHAQADHLVVAADRVLPTPAGLDDVVAGVLDIAGRTAWASVDAVGVSSGETVLIGGAAGGVGVFAVQLAVLRGARVLGTGGAATAGFLRELGAEPVEYGPGLVDRVRALAPDGVDAVLDYEGRATVAAGLELGVPPERINSNADRAAIAEGRIRNAGAHTTPGLEELRELAALVADGRVRVPIAGVRPLEQVETAYRELMAGHVHGKLALTLV